MDRIIETMAEIRFEIADGFNGITFERFTWGYIFGWNNSPVLGTNFALVYSTDGITDALEWASEDPERQVWVSDDLEFEMNEHFILRDKVGIFTRNRQKIDMPELDNFTVRKYSYNHRDPKKDLRKVILQFIDMFELNSPHNFELERYIGSILHIFNGEIWTLEDFEGNIYSALLIGRINDELNSLEMIATRKNLRKRGYAIKLINHLIYETGKSDYFGVFTINKIIDKLLIPLNFDLGGTFKILVSKIP